jgi:Alpha/beta hydrolase
MANLDQNAARLQDAIRAVITDAARADGEIADSLRRLSAQSAGLAPPDQETVAAAATAIPPRGTAPTDVKKWWDSLSPMQKESLLFTHAAEIGALDGVPAAARDRANRTHLAELKGQVVAELDRLQGKDNRSDDENKRLEDAKKKLHGIEDVEKRIDHPDPTKGQQQAFLLGIDTAGSGRAIVAAGNPDTAANVATYVPGTGARLEMAGADMDRADKMLASAASASSPSTSVITWIGYEAPQSLPDAVSEDYAEGAKKDLDRFQDGLRATHEGAPSHNTVLGHSYGSTVIGHTAHTEHINADELVFVGSPGVGVDKASQLNFPTDHVYATEAEHDMIRLSNIVTFNEWGQPVDRIHGLDPTFQQFGAHAFASDPGTAGSMPGGYSGEAHSQYWEDRNASLKNMGRIIAGLPPTAQPTR